MTDLQGLAEVRRSNRLVMIGAGAALFVLVVAIGLLLPRLMSSLAFVALGLYSETVAFLKLRGAWRYPRIMSQREAVDDLGHGLTFAAVGIVFIILGIL